MRAIWIAVVVAALATATWQLTGSDSPIRTADRDAAGVVSDVPKRNRDGVLPLTRLVGQRIMTRMTGTAPGLALRQRIRRGEVGGVILFADNIGSAAQVRGLTGRLQGIARAGGHPPLLIATDQEGGNVKRFAQLPPFSSAAELGRPPGAAARSRAAGAATAGALRRIGVTVDLAPVADVRRRPDSFLGARAFGSTASAVSAAACAFARGLRKGGVAPTLKHFPGLGVAGANTDLAAVSIDVPADSLRSDYAPYRACARHGLVMMSSAAYPRLLGRGPAVLTRAAYTRELASTGFDGVTISDDLQTPALAGRKEVEVRAARAGLDVLLFAGTEDAAAAGYRRLLAAARAGRLSRAALERSYTRILRLKAGLS
jgi:beta-N-acetylhexosaminidase